MLSVKNILQMTSLLFAMIILFCYIGWCLGYEGFIIVGHIDLPLWSLYVICSALFCINWSLQTGFVLNMYSWKVLYFSIPMTILNLVGPSFLPAIIFSGLLPTIILIIAIFCKKLGKISFIKLAIFTGVLLIYQFIVSTFSGLTLDVHVSVYQGFRLSINTILLNLLFYSIGGVKNANWMESMVFPGRTRDVKSRNEVRKIEPQSAESIPVDKFEKWVMRSVIAVVQILQWIFILWVCNLDNLFLDALVMTTSFICHGMIISKRKHLKPIILCTLAATAMFYFAARFTISVQYSQFFPIVIGLILAYTVYRISYQLELTAKEKEEKDLERLKALEEKVATAWKRLDELSN